MLFLAWLLERGANLLDAPVEAPQLQKRLAGAPHISPVSPPYLPHISLQKRLAGALEP